MLGDEDVYYKTAQHNRWVFNKLEVAIRAGVTAGPGGIPVPRPGWYCVRPVMNIRGMGLGMSKEWLTPESSMKKVMPGYFWSEWLTGDHLTFDITVKGIQDVLLAHKQNGKFVAWEKVDIKPPFPVIVYDLVQCHNTVNVETIGGKVIEIHLRPNPDLRHFKNTDIIHPVWGDGNVDIKDYEDCDGLLNPPRMGFKR